MGQIEMVENLIPSFELMLLAGLVCSYHTANSQRDMALENLRQYFPHTDSMQAMIQKVFSDGG